MFFTTIEEWLGLCLVLLSIVFFLKKMRDVEKKDREDIVRFYELRNICKVIEKQRKKL